MTTTDKTLMLAVKDGQVDHFGLLFERHHDRLFAFFYRMTADASSSEDLAQEVFVRMLKYRNTFGADSDFRGWMYQIARNVRADHFRKQPSAVSLDDPLMPVSQAVQYRHVERNEQLSVLHRALLNLSEDKRELLILARYEELRYETIASMLEIDVGAVKVRVHRAMRELRALVLRLADEETKCDVKKPKTILRNT
jgi:RNA polymerase sigma-70 factor (ECF subfamily)